jgi:hypothetical protein
MRPITEDVSFRATTVPVEADVGIKEAAVEAPVVVLVVVLAVAAVAPMVTMVTSPPMHLMK